MMVRLFRMQTLLKNLECKILHGERAGEMELIPRITLHLDKYYPFVLMRHQFQVKLSFCMTINKSQDQTLDFVGIKLLTGFAFCFDFLL